LDFNLALLLTPSEPLHYLPDVSQSSLPCPVDQLNTPLGIRWASRADLGTGEQEHDEGVVFGMMVDYCTGCGERIGGSDAKILSSIIRH